MRSALEYALQNFKRPRGKPRTTWVSQIKKDLENMNVSWTEAENICKNDKNVWLDKKLKFYIGKWFEEKDRHNERLVSPPGTFQPYRASLL